ncbi:MAG: transglutaminase domain-containing protein [Atopobiaceae bacterium]|nr:transglutaminase domain-containing protein [Atopobiaceae bacterium]
MSGRWWRSRIGERAQKALSVLLALELCVSGVPVTAFAEENADEQEPQVQVVQNEDQEDVDLDAQGDTQEINDQNVASTSDETASGESSAAGAILGTASEDEEYELLEGHLYLYQDAENPYFSDSALSAQAVTPGLENKLSEEECNEIRNAFVECMTDPAPDDNVSGLGGYRLTYEEVQALMMDVVNSHPEFWYVNSSFTYVRERGTNIVVQVYPQYIATGDELAAMTTKYNQSMADLISWVPTNGTTEEKIKAVHDWLVRNVAYDVPARDIRSSEEARTYKTNTVRDPWSAYGAMVENTAVCQGYSLAFLAALGKLGIECGIVGTDGHQWNRVKINSAWYHVDVTWDDPLDENDQDGGFDADVETWYFLKSDTGVAQEDPADNQTHKDWKLEDPKCLDEQYDSKKDWPTYKGPYQEPDPGTIAIPVAKTGLVYTGKTLVGVEAGIGYTLSNNKKSEAGEYYAVAKLADKANTKWTDGTTDDKRIKWKIDKVSIDIPAAENPTFTGNYQDGVKMGTGYTRGGSYREVNAGNYQATVTLWKNYKWKNGDEDVKTLNWKIAPAKVEIPVGKNLVYNGSTQTGVIKGDHVSTNGNTSAKDANTYTVLASLTDTKNYQWSDGTNTTKTIKWSIAAVAIDSADVTVDAVATQTYTGSEIKPSVTVKFKGTVLTPKTSKGNGDYELSYANNKNPGPATITIKGINNFTKSRTTTFTITKATKQDMYRLYNPNSGEHFYTANADEKNYLASIGWKYEGVGWVAPLEGADVYRMYNKNGGEHHYTIDAAERDNLVRMGWTYEGVGWKSGGSVRLYREYNPNAFSCNHNYTTSRAEHDWLVSLGWLDEGYAWNGVEGGRSA